MTINTMFATVCLLGIATSECHAQSLFRRPTTPQTDVTGEPDHQAPARNASLFLVEAPKPKTFALHDKVTIMISELSRQSASQKVDTKKDAGINAGVSQFPDLLSLLEARFEMESGSPIIGVEADAGKKFKETASMSVRIDSPTASRQPSLMSSQTASWSWKPVARSRRMMKFRRSCSPANAAARISPSRTPSCPTNSPNSICLWRTKDKSAMPRRRDS